MLTFLMYSREIAKISIRLISTLLLALLVTAPRRSSMFCVDGLCNSWTRERAVFTGSRGTWSRGVLAFRVEAWTGSQRERICTSKKMRNTDLLPHAFGVSVRYVIKTSEYRASGFVRRRHVCL